MATCDHCGTTLTPAPTGRPARFCSTRCRVAAHRAKNAPRFDFGDGAAIQPAAIPTPRPAPLDDQAAACVLEARALVGVMRRLGHECRPQFAWRFTRCADALDSVLSDTFGVD